MVRLVVVTLVAVSAAACSIDLEGEETVAREERRFTIADSGKQGPLDLVVSTFDGAIEVRSWDRAEVLVQIERRAASAAEARALNVNTTQATDRLTIEAADPRRDRGDGGIHIGSWRSPSVSFVVTVPRRSTVQASSGDGAIAVRDVTGTVAVKTADGAVRVERVDGDVQIESGDGAVSVIDVDGGLELNTGDGAVEVTGRVDAVRITTGDGPIRLDAREGSAMKSEWTVNTGDGEITVRLPAECNADLDTFSGDGRITVSGVGNAASDRGDDRPAQLTVRLGAGGPALRVRTGDGPITVAR
jgi:hypothetical protein